ncbi:MAG: hypothetical protein M5R36_10630 [Deltaproteobacteria bacterium]|nr:hypothetical protein [Deltaproteobacteria bacterium]
MDAKLLFRLIDEAEELGCEKIPLVGAGEPTLHTAFPRVIERFIESPMSFEVFSNAITLRDRDRDLLARAERGRLYFSVSAAKNETFLAQRPGMTGDLLARVENNVQAMVEARQGKRAPWIIIVNVINAGNFREVIPMMEQAIRLGVDEVQYKLTEIADFSPDLILSREQLQCLDLEMRHVKNLARAAGVDVQDNLDVQLKWVNPKNGNYVDGLFDRLPCRVGYEFARVRRDGLVSFCCGLKFFHNLHQMSLADHWWSAEMNHARRVAVRFPQGRNLLLPDGGLLRDEQCDYCYNYILNVHAEEQWTALTGEGVDVR